MATEPDPSEVHAVVLWLAAQLRAPPEPVPRPVAEQIAAVRPDPVVVLRPRVEPHAPLRTVAEQLAALAADDA